MLSFFVMTLVMASLAANLDMKTNLANYTTPEIEKIVELSSVTSIQGELDVLRNKSIERDKIDGDSPPKKKSFEECRDRQLCGDSTVANPQADNLLNISTPALTANSPNMTEKVIIETQILASYKNFSETRVEDAISDNLITSSANSVKESSKKFKLNAKKVGERSTEKPLQTNQHKSSHSDNISFTEVRKEIVKRNMNSISTMLGKSKEQYKTTSSTLSENQSIFPVESTFDTLSLQHPLNHQKFSPKKHDTKSDLIWTTYTTPHSQRKLSSQALTTASHEYTSPLRSDDFSENNVLSGKNLSDTTDLSGSFLRPTWETTQPRPAVIYNSVGKILNFTRVSTTTSLLTESVTPAVMKKPKTYGVLKYGNETPRRPTGPISDLKSHMESATYRTQLNYFTTETSRELGTYFADLVTGTKSVLDDITLGSNLSDGVTVSKLIQQEIPWPVKKEAVVEGDLVLGGLMMVHEREDTITCGPVMPQGGIQALEAMLYTLDRLNFGPEPLLPNITLGAHILDDCDKDTYGLEMAVDFIKGKSNKRVE